MSLDSVTVSVMLGREYTVLPMTNGRSSRDGACTRVLHTFVRRLSGSRVSSFAAPADSPGHTACASCASSAPIHFHEDVEPTWETRRGGATVSCQC